MILFQTTYRRDDRYWSVFAMLSKSLSSLCYIWKTQRPVPSGVNDWKPSPGAAFILVLSGAWVVFWCPKFDGSILKMVYWFVDSTCLTTTSPFLAVDHMFGLRCSISLAWGRMTWWSQADCLCSPGSKLRWPSEKPCPVPILIPMTSGQKPAFWGPEPVLDVWESSGDSLVEVSWPTGG